MRIIWYARQQSRKLFVGVLFAGVVAAAGVSGAWAEQVAMPLPQPPAVDKAQRGAVLTPQQEWLGQTPQAHEISQEPQMQAQPLNDPVLEARALALGEQLRCVVCQNQSIAESNAELARDLMNEVRAMLRAGKSEQEIVDFLVTRYGEFVLFKPPFDLRTLLLWVGPFVLAAVALWVLWTIVRRNNRQVAVPQLDENAKAYADALLSGVANGPLRKDSQ